MRRYRTLSCWVVALLAFLAVSVPGVALAQDDILLGAFYTSDSDYTDSIYLSYNGTEMRRIATVYESQVGNSYLDGKSETHKGHIDPSIIFHEGKFWMLSGWNRNDGKFWPMISYSSDLVHWTHPEGEAYIDGTHGIELDEYPTCHNHSDFDTVAPEWFQSKDGSLYIIFSAGYFGAFHGQPTQDKMQAYIVKVNKLTADEGEPDGRTEYLWPKNLQFDAGTAKRINIPDNASDNSDYIDGAGYAEGNTDYLVIKKDGLTNQLYKTSNIDSNNWQLVNEQVSFGYEGASIVRFDGRYLMAADHVNGTTADGVHMFEAGILPTKDWGEAGTTFKTLEGEDCAVRHGSIITLPAGSEGWEVAHALLEPDPEETAMSLQYYVHRQTYGDEPLWSKADGDQSGTTGESKRLEAIRIRIKNKPFEGNIQYRTHVQTYGWENGWRAESDVSGTIGESKRLEAIQIKLTDKMAEAYDVYYRVHAQKFGWMGWAKNGESAGTSGYAYRLEAVQVVLVDKGAAAPAADFRGAVQATDSPYYDKKTNPAPLPPSVQYYVHRQTYDWEEEWSKADGDQSGTTGQSKRLEGIRIRVENKPAEGTLQYRTHVQTYGWEDGWKTEPDASGTTGQSKRLEAIQIRLTDKMAELYDVYYRVHAQRIGWMGWAKNGESAGTAAHSFRLEAIQIVLVDKGGAAPATDLKGAVQNTDQTFDDGNAIRASSAAGEESGLDAQSAEVEETGDQTQTNAMRAQASVDREDAAGEQSKASVEAAVEVEANSSHDADAVDGDVTPQNGAKDLATATGQQIDLADQDAPVKVELVEEQVAALDTESTTPRLRVFYDGKELMEGENADFTLSFKTDEKSGVRTVTVTGRGAYTGAVTFELADDALMALVA